MANATITKAARPLPNDWMAESANVPSSLPIHLVGKFQTAGDMPFLADFERRWLESVGFAGETGRVVLLPGLGGEIAGVVLGTGGPNDEIGPLTLGGLPTALPTGTYRIEGLASGRILDAAVLSWLLGAYRFERYKSAKGVVSEGKARLVWPSSVDRRRLLAIAEPIWLARDLINTPANDMGPAELEAAARDMAETHGASFASVVGDDLLSQNFPMIHAVGRASSRLPRLVDMTWGESGAPTVTLVGKGICFDTGGLDIKNADGMLLMKKDMGGAATVLALGSMIMRNELPVRLRVILPIAENSIAGNAFRPGDILTSRNGATVEIGNTDAEGRLVLADAMALACEEKPNYLATFATLTGAARVALGPDLPPLYTDDDQLAGAVMAAGLDIDDPVWRMPFWMPYDKLLKSPIADMNHVSGGPMAGSATAALFLKRFAKGAGHYLHFDIYGWVPKAKPGKPEGGEPQGARAVFEVLSKRFGGKRE
jgi:leucyl aminopeptidase